MGVKWAVKMPRRLFTKDPDGLSEKSDSPLEVRHLGHLSHPAASFGNKKREAA